MFDRKVELPAWVVTNPELFRAAAARVDHFRPNMDYPGGGYWVPRCEHGYNPFTDTCPNCAMGEA
jgi:hypothetical protein